VVFEWLLPAINGKFHADIYDVACYSISTLVWYAVQTNFIAKKTNWAKNA